jgi:hypothetical protein
MLTAIRLGECDGDRHFAQLKARHEADTGWRAVSVPPPLTHDVLAVSSIAQDSNMAAPMASKTKPDDICDTASRGLAFHDTPLQSPTRAMCNACGYMIVSQSPQ